MANFQRARIAAGAGGRSAAFAKMSRMSISVAADRRMARQGIRLRHCPEDRR
ncbi:hypothetical protein JR065_03000 [Xanthomonas sp. AmX2]|uniref:hypothetical protein n=1 Tax=Xanthomonas sp. TaxID=29446 RepID=UPI001981A1B4|nr:hypothetical protein [Xanthomonas sp.]MBN6149295.1 hypothetical protein [Xanthomonas sp.]